MAVPPFVASARTKERRAAARRASAARKSGASRRCGMVFGGSLSLGFFKRLKVSRVVPKRSFLSFFSSSVSIFEASLFFFTRSGEREGS